MNNWKRLLTVLCLVALLTGALGVLPAFAAAEPFGMETEAESKAVAKPKPPAAKLVSNKNVQLTWTRVKGATQYQVFRREVGGTYKKIATRKVPNYTDTKAVAGKAYQYAIKVRTKAGLSAFSNPRGFIVLKKPAIKALRGEPFTYEGTRYRYVADVQWNPVKGATAYQVWCDFGSGQMQRLGSPMPASQFGNPCATGIADASPLGTVRFQIQPIYQGKFKIMGPKSAIKSVTVN